MSYPVQYIVGSSTSYVFIVRQGAIGLSSSFKYLGDILTSCLWKSISLSLSRFIISCTLSFSCLDAFHASNKESSSESLQESHCCRHGMFSDCVLWVSGMLIASFFSKFCSSCSSLAHAYMVSSSMSTWSWSEICRGRREGGGSEGIGRGVWVTGGENTCCTTGLSAGQVVGTHSRGATRLYISASWSSSVSASGSK